MAAHDEDDDFLEGCELSPEEMEDHETQELRVIFPDGLDTPDLEATAEAYRELGALDA